MSRREKDRRTRRSAEERLVLFKRRWALAAHLLFATLCLIGSQGPWYQPLLGDQPLGDPVSGRTFVARFGADAPPAEDLPAQLAPDPERPAVWARPGFLGTVVLLACVAALFFASYDLVADADIQVPTLVASVLVCACAGGFFYSVWAPQNTLRSIVEEVEGARLRREAPALEDRPSPDGGVAPVATAAAAAAPAAPRLPGLRFGWGAGLFLASAPLMLLVSLYLTFLADRTAETPS